MRNNCCSMLHAIIAHETTALGLCLLCAVDGVWQSYAGWISTASCTGV